jgi:ABC-2 type transport system permease protein
MTTESNVAPDTPLETAAVVPAALSATRPLYWSVRRELWENRSIYIAPLAAAAVVFFGFTVRALVRASHMRTLPALDPAQQYASIVMPYSMAASMIMMTALVVGAFYCVDALYSERRDRSILFWKSLPVSDLTAVLSKASIPLAVLPLIAFAASLATQLAMLVLPVTGVAAAMRWTSPPLLEMWFVMLYGLTVHALWHAPLYGWLLLVSAWARRTPLLWAVLPPLAVGVVERIVFGTSHFASLVRYRVAGAMTEAFDLKPKGDAFIRVTQLDPLGFLTSPGLWVGLLFAAAFLAAAARLRRRGEPI